MTRLTHASIACLVLAGLAAPAAAQPVRPNILVIFDTSSSMNQINDMGIAVDGSPLCNGVGDGNTADPDDAVRRTYALKKALRETLTQVGNDEANFGLARFPQLENPNQTPTCPTGHYFNDASTAVSSKFGCRMSTHGAGETTYGPWFDSGLRQFLLVDVTKRPTGAKPVAADFDPRGANLSDIYRWIDERETSSGGVITEPELRSGGTANLTFTPLGRSLLYARLYFENYVKPVDPRAGCRKNVVILVTDGDETCDGALTPLSAFRQAAELYGAGVDMYVLTDTSTGADNDRIAFFGSGGKRSVATRVSLTDSGAVKAALLKIIAEAVPPAEICNGLDDNCNNKVDEEPLPGVGASCLCAGLTEEMVGKGICKKGAQVCRGAAGIRCEGCVGPATEVCNAVDDNCNGMVDEGFALGQPCDNGLQGVCKRTGVTVCAPDGKGVVCDVPRADGTTEVCNGIDDDCDGMVDEDVPGVGETCGIGLGVCEAGKTKCENGKFVCTAMMTMGSPEICDAKDNNCNGQIDEGLGGAKCACAPYDLKTLETGECRPGTEVCRGSMPLSCEGCVVPRTEICDGKDNNCDGMTDEGNPCPMGFLCLRGKCEILCKGGEFPCPRGFYCDKADGNICKSTKCQDAGTRCMPGWKCDEGTGACVDPCAGVVCPNTGERCVGGQCQNCSTLGCPQGQICRDRQCVADPCAGKQCAAGEFCDDRGECVGICAGGCPSGQRCLRGQCTPNPCASVLCNVGQVCDPERGLCVDDRCLLKSCGAQKCVPLTGECRPDPCQGVDCSGQGTCRKCQMSSDGVPECAVDLVCMNSVRTFRVNATGGGCSCTVGGTDATGGLWGVLLLVGLALYRARRRA